MVCVPGVLLDIGENEKVPNLETKRVRGNVLLCQSCRWQHLPYQSNVNGKLHSYADRSNQDDHRHRTELDSDEAHHAKELNCHQSQDCHL